MLGAAGGVILAAAGIALAARDARLGARGGRRRRVSALFGLGTLLALSPESPPRLDELLFGDLLGVSAGDLALGAALAGTSRSRSPRRTGRSPRARSTAPPRARSAPARRWELALLVVLALTTVAAVQGLGNLLLVALVLAPAAAALNRTRRLPAALALAVGLAALAGVAGLLLSYHLDVAAGASVALCAVAIFLLALVRPPVAAARR